LNPRGAPLQGQAFLYFGQNHKAFIKAFSKLAWAVNHGSTRGEIYKQKSRKADYQLQRISLWKDYANRTLTADRLPSKVFCADGIQVSGCSTARRTAPCIRGDYKRLKNRRSACVRHDCQSDVDINAIAYDVSDYYFDGKWKRPPDRVNIKRQSTDL